MITLKSGRHPLAVSLLAFFVVSGIANILAYNHTAGNAVRTVPPLFGLLFYVILTLGSAVALVGIYWRGVLGPLLERSGLWMVSGAMAAYAVLTFALAGWRALFVVALLMGFTVGCIGRIIQIGHQLKKVHAAAVVTESTDQLEA